MEARATTPPLDARDAERADRPLRLLLVEDDEDDYLLTRELLADIPGSRFDLEWAATYDAGLEAVRAGRHDVYLFDYRLDGRNGLELLAQAVGSGVPVILLTGQGEREVDIQAMRAGASDYLVKGRIDAAMLERSIRYALERKRDQDALRRMHAILEDRVRERTAALERANEELRVEVENRRRAEEALKDADRRKDEFLAMLAHELRNPLAPISNALHFVRLRGERDEEERQAWEIMERQLEHMVRLVEDLLDVSRITRGKIRLHRRPVDVATIVASAVEGSRPLIDARRHRLEVTLPQQSVRVDGDPTRLAQVLWNLLNNSAKYTPEGGRIWLTVEANDGRVALRVGDTGVGVSAETLPRIFDLFTQAERTLDRAEGGLGIGLTLVKRLVEMHDGSVEAFSPGPGKGSEFVVRLPLLPDAAPAAGTKDSARGAAGAPSRRRVLVVDDNRDSAGSLSMLLRLIGHEVHTAHAGAEALAVVRERLPELVLLDIGLPGMDGYEVARRIRSEAALDRVVLTALTGYGGEDDRRRSREAGFNHHLVKPVDFEALRRLLDSLEAAGAE